MTAAAAIADQPVTWSDCGKYWYDGAAADAAVDFFSQHLRLTDAEWAGRPFILEAWQADDIIRPLFGWKRRDGTRRYRRGYVWVPRKNGKTELAAGVALLALVADGEMGGQVYSIASDKEQASLVFDKATAMVNMSPTLSRLLECFKPSIFCPELNASFKPLSGRPGGKHGLSASGIVGDEVHEWKSGELYTYVHQSTAARRQPLEFLISTAGIAQGYGFEQWKYCQRVLAGEIDDDETLIVIYAADPDNDWTDPATWAMANPNLGVSVKPEYLAAECEKAKASPRHENDFKRYHLNIWTEQATRWLQMEQWGPATNRWADSAFEAELEGETCFGGLDLSSTRDLTAYCLWFPPTENRPVWRKITRAFIPSMNVDARVKHDGVPFDQWIDKGAIVATDGNAIDYDFIKAALYSDAERFRIEMLGVDPFGGKQLIIQLRNEGINAVEVRQGFLTLSAPSKELERLVLREMVDHGGHPVARWCAGNAAVATDPAGNIKPAKDRSSERIDVIAADVTALATFLQQQGPERSPWDDPDFRLELA